MDFLPENGFVKLCCGHEENICSLSYVDRSNVDIFYDIKLFKSRFEKEIPLRISKEKSTFGGCCQAHDDTYKFSRISVFT